jgi:tRNA A-37 threonylcarbamoyl transferase component Bud32
MNRHATFDSPDAAPTTPDPAAPEPIFKPPGWRWVSFGEVGWWVLPDWESALLGPSGLRLDDWRRDGRLATVKTGPHRVVYRADLPAGAVFVKHFKVPSWREILRQWVRRGKGRNEGKRAVRLARIGVPTITPIALGEQRRRKFLFENYLVTPEIPGTVPLDEFLENRLPHLPATIRPRVKREVGRRIAELTARIHEAGFLHQDFHPGNLLVGTDAEGRIQLAMIDLDALRVRNVVTWRDAEANLAMLNHSFWLRSDRTDRHRFLVDYLNARTGPKPDVAGLARRIETATREWAERLWRRWGKRCRGSNKYFQAYRGSEAQGVAANTLDPAVVRSLMDDLDAPFHHPETTILKSSRTTTVAELTLPVDGKPTRVIYKRFNRKKWLDPILAIFRPTRAWRAWQAGQHLASRALPTPQNLAYFRRSRPGRRIWPQQFFPHDTYLVTVKAEPSITLADYVDRVLPSLGEDARRVTVRRVARSLARLVRTLHERSLSQRDLKAANILIEGDPDSTEPSLSLIDLVGVELQHPIRRGRVVQNLARLHVSLERVPGRTRTDALRFLRSYLPWAFTAKARWKSLWRAVEARAHAKRERNERRGRPLS